MHNEFSLEGTTVDSPIISQQLVVCYTGIALLKLKQRKKYLHTRMRFHFYSVATCQLEYLLSCGDIETNPEPTGGGNLCPTCQNTKVVKCTVCDHTILMLHQNLNSLQNKSEEIAMVIRDLRAHLVF